MSVKYEANLRPGAQCRCAENGEGRRTVQEGIDANPCEIKTKLVSKIVFLLLTPTRVLTEWLGARSIVVVAVVSKGRHLVTDPAGDEMEDFPPRRTRISWTRCFDNLFERRCDAGVVVINSSVSIHRAPTATPAGEALTQILAGAPFVGRLIANSDNTQTTPSPSPTATRFMSIYFYVKAWHYLGK